MARRSWFLVLVIALLAVSCSTEGPVLVDAGGSEAATTTVSQDVQLADAPNPGGVTQFSTRIPIPSLWWIRPPAFIITPEVHAEIESLRRLAEEDPNLAAKYARAISDRLHAAIDDTGAPNPSIAMSIFRSSPEAATLNVTFGDECGTVLLEMSVHPHDRWRIENVLDNSLTCESPLVMVSYAGPAFDVRLEGATIEFWGFQGPWPAAHPEHLRQPRYSRIFESWSIRGKCSDASGSRWSQRSHS